MLIARTLKCELHTQIRLVHLSSMLRKDLVKQKVNYHAGHGDIHP
jgi:hypothetical protein